LKGCPEQLVSLTQARCRKEYTNVGLFDGQTRDLLAFIKIEHGSKSGIVFDRGSLTNPGWDDANEYIAKMIAEDRN
jgi:hypothetical protein